MGRGPAKRRAALSSPVGPPRSTHTTPLRERLAYHITPGHNGWSALSHRFVTATTASRLFLFTRPERGAGREGRRAHDARPTDADKP